MELTRLARVVRDRWVFVVVIAVIGLLAGWVLTDLSNRQIQPLFQAEAPLRIDPVEGQSVADQTSELETVQQLAISSASDLLTSTPGASITIDIEGNRVVFTALGDSQLEARERAAALIESYFDVDPIAGGSVDELLAELEVEAQGLAAQLAEAQRTLTVEEQELIQQHDLLDLQIAAISQLIVDLTVADAGASESDQGENAERRQELEALRDEYVAQKAALPPKPTTDLSATESLQVNAIQRRLDLLALDYERLYLRKLGVTNTGHADPIVIRDLTPQPTSPMTNGALGLVIGAGFAVMGLAFITVTRKPVWLAEDVRVPLLGEVPGRKVVSAPGAPWYDVEEGGPRKVAIQALRSAVEGRLSSSSVTLGVAGLGVSSPAVHALAVDLAVSFAAAGQNVLLVDADFDNPSASNEYRVRGTDLASILRLSGPGPSLSLEVRQALNGATYIREGLAVIPAGRSPASPADAVSGRQFRTFVEDAGAMFDIVLVVGSEITAPTTQVQLQRLGSALLLLSQGRSTIPSVESLIQDLSDRRVVTLGAVFLQRAVSVSLRRESKKSKDIVTTMSQPGLSPINRLTAYPFPSEKGSGVIRADLLRDLADRLDDPDEQPLWAEDDDDKLGVRVLTALDEAKADAYEPVSEYVVSRVEDIVSAVAGQGNVPSNVLDLVTRDGFVVLVPVPGRPTIGDLLKAELQDEVGSDKLADRMVEILAQGQADIRDFDSWIARNFLARHAERTGREPLVWHFSSSRGSVQVLIAARRLTRQKLDLITTEVVRGVIDQLQRRLANARRDGDDEETHEVERSLDDARQFEAILGRLGDGEGDDAKIFYPWRMWDRPVDGWAPLWAEGIQPNLAPVQRLGLLPYPVLTDEELARYSNDT